MPFAHAASLPIAPQWADGPAGRRDRAQRARPAGILLVDDRDAHLGAFDRDEFLSKVAVFVELFLKRRGVPVPSSAG